MASVSSPTSSDINNFFAVKNEMESSSQGIDRNGFAKRITEIEHENYTFENLQKVKKELYEMTVEVDQTMSERAFLITCYVELHIFSQLRSVSGMRQYGISQDLERLKTQDSKEFFEKNINDLLLQIEKEQKLKLIDNVFVSGWSNEKILECFNLIKGDPYLELVKFNSSLEAKNTLAECANSVREKYLDIFLEAKKLDPDLDIEEEQESDQDSDIEAVQPAQIAPAQAENNSVNAKNNVLIGVAIIVGIVAVYAGSYFTQT